jgi:hypothetical protein
MNRVALTAKRQRAYERGRTWVYVMVSRERGREILRTIVSGPRPGVTLSVWEAVRLRAQWNTGLIEATVPQLAEDAGTVPNEAYRALSRLVEIGALVRVGRGRYALNPDVAWSGSLGGREQAASELTPAE